MKPHDLILAPQADAIAIRPVAEADWPDVQAGLTEAQTRWAETQGFTARSGQYLLLPSSDGALDSILFGLGTSDTQTPDIWGYAGLPAHLPAGAYVFHGLEGIVLEHAALGWGLAQYVFDRYKTSSAEPRGLCLVDEVLKQRTLIALESLCLVRDLVNTPANDMGPEELSYAAQHVAKNCGADFSEIVDEALLERNFPAIYTVGQASTRRPRLIELNWGEETAPRLTLVGKGVCFDTGGLDLKPASAMRLMKKDMGGAAHALGLAHWIMKADLPVRLHVLIAAVENSVDGNAFRPGDIIKTRAGLSVEIGNTDAEGRLVLADALTYAGENDPTLVLDFATLTGAARIALGGDIPALFTDDHDLAADLAQAAADEGDPVWRLPLYSPYEEDLASSVADLGNIADSGFAGAITAALFLRRFAPKSAPWAHFDIYAWNQRPRPGRPKGGEAMALRTLMKVLTNRFG